MPHACCCACCHHVSFIRQGRAGVLCKGLARHGPGGCSHTRNFMAYGQLARLRSQHVPVFKHAAHHFTAARRDEDAAARALQGLSGRFYAGRPILVEFSPVTDFREATCRQYEENTCTRGGYCNFMHLRPISKCAARPLTRCTPACASKHSSQDG